MTCLGTGFPLVFPYNVKSQLCFHNVRHTTTSQGSQECQQERRYSLNSGSVLLSYANVYMVPGRRLQRPQPDDCPTQTNPSHTRHKSKEKEKNIIIIQGPENSVRRAERKGRQGTERNWRGKSINCQRLTNNRKTKIQKGGNDKKREGRARLNVSADWNKNKDTKCEPQELWA